MLTILHKCLVLAILLRAVATHLRPRLAATLLALAPALAVAAPAPLQLDDRLGHVEAWPALTVLADPGGKLSADAALAAASRFEAPRTAYATLGVNTSVVWLRIPVTLPAGGDGQWVLNIDYAVLNRVDVFTATGGKTTRQAVLGNLQPDPYRLRAPAALLDLAPGQQHLILLRVENIGSMILPIRLSKPGPFHTASLNQQMLQGLLVGLSLCLLIYSLAQWVSLREPLFGKYALLVAGTTMFSVEFFGLGTQYLWHGNRWMTLHAGGLFSLMAACGAYLFVEQALARPGMDRTFSRLMKGGAALSLAAAVAYGFDLIGVVALVAIVSTLGVMPMLLGMPGAFMRARSGNAVGTYFLIGWAVSFVSAVVLSQVISGKLPATFWTMHALQFGNLFDMLVFMRILGLRTKAIEAAMLRAEAATRMKSDFLANMSHEIRTPMNAIMGMSRLAMMSDPSPKLRNYLGKIHGAGEHLLGIVNDILDIARIEAGKLALDPAPFALDEILERLSGIGAEKADAGRVALVFRVGRAVPMRLVGDPLRLGQVLINLVNNAVKFTPEGEIVVAVDVDRRDAAAVTLRFSVTDTGIGMNEAQLGRLFQPFSQADSSITRKYGGTGLGLSISKELVELMGGTIAASSTPGTGSCFSFSVTLGIADPAGVTVAAPMTHDLSRLHGARILLVDDNADNREVALDFMAAARMQVDVAASGAQALAAIGAGDYDLVLMDIQMQEMDGLTATRRIRAMEGGASLPVIAMTAHAMASDRARSMEAGMNGHITKPIDPDLLFGALLTWIEPARLAGRAVPPAPAAQQDCPPRDGAPLPRIPGVDWRQALAAVDGKGGRLERRVASFVNEYQGALPAVQKAMDAGDYGPLESLAHNLRSSARYVGAADLAVMATRVERALRAGDLAAMDDMAPALFAQLEEVVAGLAQLAANAAPLPVAAADVAPLVDRLASLLRSDNARCEDALLELKAALAGKGYERPLSLIQRAVDDVEYQAAIVQLEQLAGKLEVTMEETP